MSEKHTEPLSAKLVGWGYGEYKFDNRISYELFVKAHQMLTMWANQEDENVQAWLNLLEDDGWTDEDCKQILMELRQNRPSIRHEFTEHEVQSIRRQREAKVPLRALAKEFNCSQALISKIARRIIYKNI